MRCVYPYLITGCIKLWGACPCGHDPHGRVPVHTASKKKKKHQLTTTTMNCDCGASAVSHALVGTPTGMSTNWSKSWTTCAETPRSLGDLDHLDVRDHNGFLNEMQPWDHDCHHHNLHLENLHDLHNKDIGRYAQAASPSRFLHELCLWDGNDFLNELQLWSTCHTTCP